MPEPLTRTTLPASRGGLLLLIAAVSVASLVAACLFGPVNIPVGRVLGILAQGMGLAAPGPDTDPLWKAVVLDMRLSRVCLSWLVGAALGLSGCVFQGLLRNPLADPFTLGVSAGAAFGASLAIFLGLAGRRLIEGSGLFSGLDALPPAGMLGALAALTAVILLARAGGRLKRETLVLGGIVVATFLSALISLIKSLDEESVAGIVFWIMGSFQGRGWAHVLVFVPYFLLGLAPVLLLARELDLLSLGETQARQLGVNVSRVRLILLVAASLLAGAAVSVSGVIGFVGLMVPHLMRLILGAEHRPLLPACGLAGGMLLLWADVLARTIPPHGAELPVGVVTALLGGPFFCLLLRRRAGGLS